MDEINEKAKEIAFEAFAELHPLEAYHLDKGRFCDFVRKYWAPGLSNEEIHNVLKETFDEK